MAYQPQCAAVTENGKQCKNSARGTSRYCASHKGHQPKTLRGTAKKIEGKSWSATDKLTDRTSVGRANIKPRVAGAKDTAIATRHKAKPSKQAKLVKAAKAVRTATRSAPVPRRARRPAPSTNEAGLMPEGGGYAATILQPERDYLVVYEEPDPDGLPADDALLLDIDAGQPVSLGEVDLEQKLDLELSNNTNWVGRLGFVISIVGAVLGFGVCAWFAAIYPKRWYDTSTGTTSGSSLVPATALAAVVAFLLMLAGVILTHYGRRIQARGNLSRMRIVEKAFQPRVALGDEN